MGWQFEGKCVVTGEMVEEAMPRMGDSVELISPSLGRYRVSGSALEMIGSLSLEERMAAFERAKANTAPGAIPLITTYSFAPR